VHYVPQPPAKFDLEGFYDQAMGENILKTWKVLGSIVAACLYIVYIGSFYIVIYLS